MCDMGETYNSSQSFPGSQINGILHCGGINGESKNKKQNGVGLSVKQTLSAQTTARSLAFISKRFFVETDNQPK